MNLVNNDLSQKFCLWESLILAGSQNGRDSNCTKLISESQKKTKGESHKDTTQSTQKDSEVEASELTTANAPLHIPPKDDVFDSASTQLGQAQEDTPGA
jgi:hypothetical protein